MTPAACCPSLHDPSVQPCAARCLTAVCLTASKSCCNGVCRPQLSSTTHLQQRTDQHTELLYCTSWFVAHVYCCQLVFCLQAVSYTLLVTLLGMPTNGYRGRQFPVWYSSGLLELLLTQHSKFSQADQSKVGHMPCLQHEIVKLPFILQALHLCRHAM